MQSISSANCLGRATGKLVSFERWTCSRPIDFDSRRARSFGLPSPNQFNDNELARTYFCALPYGGEVSTRLISDLSTLRLTPGAIESARASLPTTVATLRFGLQALAAATRRMFARDTRSNSAKQEALRIQAMRSSIFLCAAGVRAADDFIRTGTEIARSALLRRRAAAEKETSKNSRNALSSTSLTARKMISNSFFALSEYQWRAFTSSTSGATLKRPALLTMAASVVVRSSGW